MFHTIKELLHFLEQIHAEIFLAIVAIIGILILLLMYFTRDFYTMKSYTRDNSLTFKLHNNQSQRPLWITAFIIENVDGISAGKFRLTWFIDPAEPDLIFMGRDHLFCETKVQPKKSALFEVNYKSSSLLGNKTGTLVLRLQKRRGENFHALHYKIMGKTDGSVQIISQKKVKPNDEYYSV